MEKTPRNKIKKPRFANATFTDYKYFQRSNNRFFVHFFCNSSLLQHKHRTILV